MVFLKKIEFSVYCYLFFIESFLNFGRKMLRNKKSMHFFSKLQYRNSLFIKIIARN